MLRNKAQKNIYRFKKEYNKRGVEVNTLYNYKNKPVYRAYVTEKGQSENTYCFHDIGKKIILTALTCGNGSVSSA